MLADYLPPVVRKIKTIQSICKVEQPYFDEAEQEIENILNRVFITLTDEKGLKRFEEIYGITPKREETIAQRKTRVLLRNIKKNISLSEVLTILQGHTAEVNLNCDYDNDEITIVLMDETTNIAIIYRILDDIAPLNVYIKEELYTKDDVAIVKSAEYNDMHLNYKLGRWGIGRLNFGKRGNSKKLGGDKVKLSPKIFTGMKEVIKKDIKKIVINNELKLTDFEIKNTGNKVTISYLIKKADTEKIKKVSFLSEEGEEVAVLNADLDIDVDIEMTQEFEVREVE